MKASQSGADNLWKYMSDVKWSRRHTQFTVLNSMDEEEELNVSNHVMVMPEDTKLVPVIERYMIRTNYFVEYLHYDNNGALDGFIDHKNNMYVLNNENDACKTISDVLYKKYKIRDFRWFNQSYTSLATSLFKQMCGYLPESQYNKTTQQALDDFYPRALQWCSTGVKLINPVSVDIAKCYKSILINNTSPMPVYTIHDIIEPFDGYADLCKNGEFYINKTVIKTYGVPLKLEAGFYSRNLILYLVDVLNMPIKKIKWKITTKRALAGNTFRNFIIYICKTFPENQAKKLANSFIGELGRKYLRTDHGFACRDMDTAQCIWTSA